MNNEHKNTKPAADKIDPARRSLLKAAPLGALAVVTGHAVAAEPEAPAAAPEPEEAKGYRETEHVKRYYATAAYW
jgi:hypothetical protein